MEIMVITVAMAPISPKSRGGVVMEFNEQETPKIDLLVFLDNFLKEMRRHWFLAIVLVLVCAAAMASRQYLTYRPTYTASVSFTVKV